METSSVPRTRVLVGHPGCSAELSVEAASHGEPVACQVYDMPVGVHLEVLDTMPAHLVAAKGEARGRNPKRELQTSKPRPGV